MGRYGLGPTTQQRLCRQTPCKRVAFAASNSSCRWHSAPRSLCERRRGRRSCSTGHETEICLDDCSDTGISTEGSDVGSKLIVPSGEDESSGIFSRSGTATPASGKRLDYRHRRKLIVAVGGDYRKPDNAAGTAALHHRRRQDLAPCPNPTPRLPLRRSLLTHHQNLDHRRPQRHRHLHRRRPQLAPPEPTPQANPPTPTSTGTPSPSPSSSAPTAASAASAPPP